MAEKISVTGASGLVGRRFVALLCERGLSPRVLVRRPVAVAPNLETVVGDLRERRARALLLAGTGVVVHCAGVMAHDDAEREIREVNEEATLSLLEEARVAGVRRFVFVSTVAVYGGGDLLGVTEERAPGPLTAYARSKVAIEAALRASRGLEWVVLRPCAIYGPGETRLLPWLDRVVRSQTIPLVRHGRTLFDLVHVDDVARVLELSASAAAAAGETFHVAEGVPRDASSILALLGRILGVAPRIVRVPAAVARGANRLSRFFARARGRGDPLPFDPVVLAALSEHRHFDVSRARRLLGWSATRSLEQGLAEAFSPRDAAAAVAAG
jgi:nucleoside-diphosphate-sugar epimerase